MKTRRNRTIVKARRVSICTSTIATAALVLAQVTWFASPASATTFTTPFGTEAASGVLTDATGLIMNGGGLLQLNAANTYTGTTVLNDGSVALTAPGALGTDASAITVAGLPLNAVFFDSTSGGGGGNLTFGGDITIARDFSIRGQGSTGGSAALTSVGNNTISGNIATIANVTNVGARIYSTNGKLTLSGLAPTIAAATTLQLGGNGNIILSGNIAVTTGALQRNGGGGLVEITGTNLYSGATTLSNGFMRVSDQTNLGTSTAAGAIALAGGTFEVRTDAGSFATKGVAPSANATMFLDHLVGSTAQNYTVAFKNLTQTINTTTTLNGRDGYGATFTQYTSNGNNNSVVTNNLNGLLTIGVAGTGTNFWGQADATGNRTMTLNGNGDTVINGAITATAGASTFAHNFTKAGTGTLTIVPGTTSASSTYAGLTNIQAGTLAISNIKSLNNTAVTAASQINIGSGTNTGTLSFIGAGAAADYTVAKIVNLQGTTGGAVINANQTGANPVLISAISNSDAGTSAKTFTLGGTSAADNAINAIIPNSAGQITLGSGATSLTKTGSGTWVLGGANTYTGATTISGGTLKVSAAGSIAAASAITFNSNATTLTAGGALEYANGAGVASTLSLGALTPTLGAGTVTATSTGGAAGITFASVGTIGKGTGVNFVTTGSAGGAMTLTGLATTTATTLPGNGNFYFNGNNFAVSTAGVLGAPTYTPGGAIFNQAGAGAATLATGVHNEVTGAITAQTVVTVTSLKMTAFDLTLAGNLTVNTGAAANNGGILQTGGTANINGAGLITTAGAGAVVIRVDGAADVLSLGAGVNIGSTTTGGLTKNGAGTLVINGTNAQTGTTSINEGTVRLLGTGRLSATASGLDLRQGATLDLGGTTTIAAVAALNGAGTITNSGATPATFATTGAGTFSGIIQDGAGVTNVTKNGTTGAPTWSGLNTYTGVTTIGGTTGIVSVPILANIGTASGIGSGVIASNAASLVFSGTTGGINYTGTTSVATDRLFTLNGSAVGSGGQIANSSGNNSSLIFSNFGGIVFGAGATVAQTLTLGGASTGDNVFNPLIADNAALATSVNKVGAGLWILGNTNTYTGTTTVTAGILRANGATLPAASNLTLAGGTFESSGTLTRTIGALAGNLQWTANGSGGFSAAENKLTVNIAGAPTWGTTAGFLGTGTLLLGSATSLNEVEVTGSFGIASGVALAAGVANTTAANSTVTLTAGTTAGLTLGQVVTNPNIPVGATIASITSATSFTLSANATTTATGGATTVAPGGFRQINVTDNASTASDVATISAAITGDANLRLGAGTLNLFGANTYTGNTLLAAGVLNVKTLGNSTGAPGSSNLGATGTGAPSLQLLGGLLDYVGAGEVSSRAIQAANVTGSTTPNTNTIRSNGTGTLILTNVVNGADPVGRIIAMAGENLGPNEIQNILADNGGPLRLTKVDGGIWNVNVQHTFTGGVGVTGGTLGIGADALPAAGAPTSGPLGTGTLSLSGGNIMAVGGDRIITNPVSVTATSGLQGDNSFNIDSTTTVTASSTLNNFIVAGTGKTLNFRGGVTSDASTNVRTLTFGGSGESIVTGVLSDGAGGALALAVNATGGGILRLAGAAPNTYGASTLGGTTTLTAGTLSLEKAGAIPNGPGNLITLAGGTLQASTDAIGVIPNPTVNLTGNPTIAGVSSIDFQGTVTNNGGNRTITNNLPAGKTLTTSGTTNLSESTTARTLTYAGTGQTQVTGLIVGAATGGTIASVLTKTGTGTLNITGTANTYSGATNVSGGILNVASLAAGGTPSSIGQAAVAGTNLVLNGGTLQYTGATPQTTNKLFSVGTAGATIDSSGAGTLSFTGTTAVLTPGVSATPRVLTLSGTGGTSAAPNVLASQLVAGTVGTSEISLTKAGTGTWSLSSATGNTYTGGTTITGGILAANNTTGSATGTGAITLAGGSLGGSGTVSGAIVGGVGGNIAPGNSIGTLNATSVNLSAGGGFSLEINSNTKASDKLVLSGALTLGTPSPLTITDLNLGAGTLVAGDKFQFISYATQTGLFSVGGNTINDIDTNSLDTFVVGTYTYGIDYNDGTNVSLRVVVPEPGTIGSIIAGCGMLLGLRRRRKA